MNRHPEEAANGFFVEDAYSIVGSLISIFVGAIFLMIAVLFTATLHGRNRSIWRKSRGWNNRSHAALEAEKPFKRAEISVDVTRVDDVLVQADFGAYI